MENAFVLLGILTFPFLVERVVRRFWIAVILTTISLSALLHVAGWIGAGYIDPFYRISIPVSLVTFVLWSIVTIWIIRRARKRDASDSRGANSTSRSN